MPRFKQLLQSKLARALTKEELELLPAGFQRVGHCIILRLHKNLLSQKEIIGETAIALIPGTKTACRYTGAVKGMHREPQIEYIAGEHNTMVEHREHGCIFRFDITKLMWSMGNMNERKRMYENVKEGEIVVDFFAGVGYWSIPIAKHAKPKHVYAIDANEDAIEALRVNQKINKIPHHLLTIIHGKCEEEAGKLGKIADRVILGYLPAPQFALPAALHVLKEEGGIIHYEGICEEGKYEELLKEVRTVAEQYGKQAELIHAQPVKSVAPKKWHYTLDMHITPI